MATYFGFSTLFACQDNSQQTNLPTGADGGTGGIMQGIKPKGKYRYTDEDLVLIDFLNALKIRQGEVVGRPEYGTTLWSFIFEPNTADVQNQIVSEIQRVATQDSRIILNQVVPFPQENGILIELEIAFQPFNNAKVISLFFDQATNSVLAS